MNSPKSHAQTPAFGSSPAWLAPFLLALAVFACLAWRFDFVCDDAYISFRYSKHMAAGEGLAYNLGRPLPVEGYSNFLWVVWLGLFEWLDWSTPLWARITSVTCGVLLLYSVTRFAERRLALTPLGIGAVALVFASLPSTAMWATGGLATMATALTVFLCYERLLGDPERPRPWQAGLFAVLTVLLRADGVLWMTMLFTGAGLTWLISGRPKALIRACLIAGTLLSLAFLAHILWRHSVYGDWQPNTARIKAGFSGLRLQRGLMYSASYLLFVPAVLIALISAMRRWQPGLVHVWLPASMMLIGALTYASFVGGDFMPFGRFLFSSLPFAALLIGGLWHRAHQVAEAASSTPKQLLPAAFSLACILTSIGACFDLNLVPRAVHASALNFRMSSPKWQSEVERWRDMSNNVDGWKLTAKAVGQHTRQGESLIWGAIGCMGYFTELFLYDNYGLVSPEVLERGVIHAQSSPGHDLQVDADYFYPAPYGEFVGKPTFLTCYLSATAEAQEAATFRWWAKVPKKVLPVLAQRYRIPLRLLEMQTYPLDPEQGFPAGATLHLVRIHWAN